MRTADNLTAFMCRLSGNLGVSTTWNPQGLSRPVIGLLVSVSKRYERGGVDASSDVTMAVTTEVMVFWNVTPCSLVHTKRVADVGNVFD